jgi:hypothetical protein
MWPFRRRPRAPDPAETLAQQARLLAESASRVTTEAAGLAQRERALAEREVRLDERLRRDAKSLDERRDALALLGRELRAREDRVEALERRTTDLAGREGELVERERRLAAEELSLRRRLDELDGVERRLAAREDELHAREARLLADELSVRRRADELAARRQPPGEAASAPAMAVPSELDRCVLFVPGADGYRLVALDVTPPTVGESLEVDGERFDVLRLGPSPLPGDERPCVYLAA